MKRSPMCWEWERYVQMVVMIATRLREPAVDAFFPPCVRSGAENDFAPH